MSLFPNLRKSTIAKLTGASARVSRAVSLHNSAQLLSPIDKYIYISYLENDKGLFDRTYEDWRVKKINKILEIFGIDYFKGRSVLEIGAGHGDLGAFLASIGAEVLCLDGRLQNVNFARLKHRNVENIRFQQFNLENDFSEFGRFDLLIHFGLLYHIRNMDEHLACSFRISDQVLMETVVCDSTDPNKILFFGENKAVDEEALDGVGSNPSPFYVERIAEEHGFRVSRHFTADLNASGKFFYDWPHKNDNSPGGFKMRRFWLFHR